MTTYFSGDVDVVVTDGFTGNVALKTMEGAAGLIADRMRQEFNASWLDKLAGLVARPSGAAPGGRRYRFRPVITVPAWSASEVSW